MADELSSAMELAIDYAKELKGLDPEHELLRFFPNDGEMTAELQKEFEQRFWKKDFSMESSPGYLVNTVLLATFAVVLKREVERLHALAPAV